MIRSRRYGRRKGCVVVVVNGGFVVGGVFSGNSVAHTLLVDALKDEDVLSLLCVVNGGRRCC